MTERTQEQLTVGVRDLRANLSRYLGEVAEGASFVITERGVPVARLGAIDRIPPGLLQMVAEGRLQLATKPATDPAMWDRPRSRGSVSDIVIEQRR
jgi:prevent-host-death family protein